MAKSKMAVLNRDLREAGKGFDWAAVLTILGFAVHTSITVWDLYADWRVWVDFERDGISDSALLPPSTSWMDFWLAFTVTGTFLALVSFLTGVVSVVLAVRGLLGKKPVTEPVWCGCIFGCSSTTREEILSFLYLLLEDTPLLILAYFYYIVQKDCKELNNINMVLLSEASTTLSIGWRIMRLIFRAMRRFGLCCDFCYSSHDRNDTGPEELCPCEGDKKAPKACRYAIAPGLCGLDAVLKFVVFVAGFVAIGLTISILDESADDNVKVLRSSPRTDLVNVSEVVERGIVSFIEAFALEAASPNATPSDLTVCRIVFYYDSHSHEVLHNFALVDLGATSSDCNCTENHDLCRPFYDDLFYGFTETLEVNSPDDSDIGFRPYKCYDNSLFIGLDRSNDPPLDTNLPIPCECPETNLTSPITVKAEDLIPS